MCGINGAVSLRADAADYALTVSAMNQALVHRGPDDDGVFSERGIGLGHRRLSIIDLSEAGHQPMRSADGRFVVVFNGEIYNFRELRNQLDYPFKSHSDTEVLVAAWQRWGAECVDRLVGMFAFAVWDRKERELQLIRDRLGIKPLYYYKGSDTFLFSSEVRGLLASGLIPREMDRVALFDYLRYQCVHQPRTIIEGVSMLSPGHVLSLKEGVLKTRRYWYPITSGRPRASVTKSEAKTAVYESLLRAVERRLVADVPFGAFLSGGIDSSAIVALMTQVTSEVNSFSVSFAEEEFSEAKYARLVASKFKTRHHEIQLTPEDFLALLPQALDHMDHPSGDGPNTYVVSKATKEAGITMALSGLGGDELFAGYEIFTASAGLQRLNWVNWIPRAGRRFLGNMLTILRPSVATAKISEVLAKPEVSAIHAYPLYRQVFLDQQIEAMVRDKPLPANRVESMVDELQQSEGFSDLPLLSKISLLEMGSYMQNVLLRDTDQMSMAHALEVRVPFLDHELVELVLSLSDSTKFPVTPKQLLVESLGNLLPKEIVHRPKMGFTLPYARWMKRELFDFCNQRIAGLAQRRFFEGSVVEQYWRDFLNGKGTISWSRLWMLIVLEHWLDRNGIS